MIEAITMILGTVIGNVWATRKEEGLTGMKFLLIQPEKIDKESAPQPIFVAIDRIGAGLGDHVMVTTGTPASYVHTKQLPIDALIIAIVDTIGRGEANG